MRRGTWGRSAFLLVAGVGLVGLVGLVGCGAGAGSNGSAAAHGPSPSAAAASPSPDLVTANYVELVHDYWVREQAADEASNGSNVAAEVCLGVARPGAVTNLELIDPGRCRARAVALLANAQRFLSDLQRTPAPPRFAQDDQAFRTQLPKAIADLKALIAATGTGNRDTVLRAATAYDDDMYPVVTDALNDVDPAVRHP